MDLKSIQGTSRNTIEWVRQQLLAIGNPDLEVWVSLDGGKTIYSIMNTGNNHGRNIIWCSNWLETPTSRLFKANRPRFEFRGMKIPEVIRVLNIYSDEPWRLVEISGNLPNTPDLPITHIEEREDCCVLIYDHKEIFGWEYLYDEPERIEEYIEAYQSLPLNDLEKYTTMRLILASSDKKPTLEVSLWERIEPLLLKDHKLHLTSLNFWASWEWENLYESWISDKQRGISPRIREVCDILLQEHKVIMGTDDQGYPEMKLIEGRS